jgi:hypothetical protein
MFGDKVRRSRGCPVVDDGSHADVKACPAHVRGSGHLDEVVCPTAAAAIRAARRLRGLSRSSRICYSFALKTSRVSGAIAMMVTTSKRAKSLIYHRVFCAIQSNLAIQDWITNLFTDMRLIFERVQSNPIQSNQPILDWLVATLVSAMFQWLEDKHPILLAISFMDETRLVLECSELEKGIRRHDRSDGKPADRAHS